MTGRSIFAVLGAFAVFGASALTISSAAAQERSYGETRELPWQSQGTVKDGYPEPVPPPPAGYGAPLPSYKDDAPPPRTYRKSSACLTKPDLRLALKSQGWHNFEDVEYRRESAVMTADNDRGRRFEVEFDACTGHVVEAKPLVTYAPPPPPRVYYERPRYYGHYDYYGPPRPYVGVHVYRRWDWR